MKPTQESLSLRPATVDDREFAYATTRDTMREYTVATWGTWNEEDVRRRTNENIDAGTTSIILLGAARIGIRVVEHEADCIRLAQLFILPAYQRRGLGSKLIGQLLAEARAAGLPLRLRVLRVNPAFNLYQRMGFKVVEATPERYFMEHPT
jgi:GNAT superfamily N-acetyltransferase